MTIAGDGTNDVINRVGASTSGLLALSGDGQNRVDNSGDFSNGLRITGSGSNAIANRVGATIRSTFTVTGDGRNVVFNWGTLTNGYTSTGPAVDLFLNRGSISTDVNLGGGNDRFQIVEGNMTNNALLGDGDDYALISGGNIANSVSGGAGEDVVDWTGGTIGSLLMGPGEDLATLTGLSQDELKFIPLDGGTDAIDRMVWSGTLGTNVSRITNWELIELNDGSELIHNGTLTLGDAGVGTGRLVIDPTSTMFAYGFTRSIVPGGAGQLVTVTNQGTIDLVDPTGTPSYPQDRLTITGDFYGDGANGPSLVRLDTYLGNDGSPSDRLIIDRGSACGATGLEIVNADGAGGADRRRDPGGRGDERRRHPGRRLPPVGTGGRRCLRVLPFPRQQDGHRREQLVPALGAAVATSSATAATAATASAATSAAATSAATSSATAAAATAASAAGAAGAAASASSSAAASAGSGAAPSTAAGASSAAASSATAATPAAAARRSRGRRPTGRRCRSMPRCRRWRRSTGARCSAPITSAWARCPGPRTSPRRRRSAIWARLIGYDGHKDAEGDAENILGSPSFDLTFGAIQVGTDLHRAEGGNGAARPRRRLFRLRARRRQRRAPAGEPPRRRRRHQVRRGQPRRLLDPDRRKRLVSRRRAPGDLVRRPYVEPPRRRRRRHHGLGPRGLGRGRLSLRVRRRLGRRAAGAARLPDLQLRRLRRPGGRGQLQRHRLARGPGRRAAGAELGGGHRGPTRSRRRSGRG